MCFFKKSTHFFLFLLHGHLKTKLVSVGKKPYTPPYFSTTEAMLFTPIPWPTFFATGIWFSKTMFSQRLFAIFMHSFLFFSYILTLIYPFSVFSQPWTAFSKAFEIRLHRSVGWNLEKSSAVTFTEIFMFFPLLFPHSKTI